MLFDIVIEKSQSIIHNCPSYQFVLLVLDNSLCRSILIFVQGRQVADQAQDDSYPRDTMFQELVPQEDQDLDKTEDVIFRNDG